MIIDARTKISAILKEKPEALDAIVSLNKHFKKLKNPLLRKVLSARVTVAQAAQIGHIDTEKFLQKMEEIGFDVRYDQAIISGDSVQESTTKTSVYHTLDVRPVIESGKDPFKQIMTALQSVPEGKTLLIINTFVPVPLINILTEKGMKVQTEKVQPDEYHTYITKTDSSLFETDKEDENPLPTDEFSLQLIAFGEKIKEIDVRHLAMPEPMVNILDALSVLPEDHALYVHHKKIPQFLLPELKKRGYTWLVQNGENEVGLLIYKL